ncbi:MAG: NAD(P)H-hydrate epimerase [Sedimentisphaerales bacterium]|nr:NAD(P)H-hydrate epimerase [Sedimentisphaerales bacterium]
MSFWQTYNTTKHLILPRQQVRDYDAWAIQQMAIPGVVLMENAGRSAAEIALKMLCNHSQARVCIFCGAGNNGGDGLTIARHLANHGLAVQIICCAPREKITGEALINLTICDKMKLPMVWLEPSEKTICPELHRLCDGCNLIVDAIFGTGLKGELSSFYVALISYINSLKIPILAVDIPSGLDCDQGIPLPVCIEAAATVSFAAAKPGFFEQGKTLPVLGELYIASIGIVKQ